MIIMTTTMNVNSDNKLVAQVKTEPLPLRRVQTQPAEFPVDVCPPLIRDTILSLHDKIQAPIAICAQSVLAVINLAVQAHMNVRLPFGQIRPISCYFLTIASSGERKTSCDNEVIKFIEQKEEHLKENYKEEYYSWKNDLEAWEKQRSQILTDKKHYPDHASKKFALDQIGNEPRRPITPILICTEPTFEGLCKLMLHGQPSLGVFSSEGGQFIGGHSMREENKIRTAAALSDLWDGKPIKRIRSSDEITTLYGRRLCMHLMAQPNIATGFLSDDDLRDQGLLSRILTISPVTAAGTRLNRTVKESSNFILEEFGKELTKIMDLPLTLKPDSINELAPKILALTPEAKTLFYEYVDEIERKIGPDGELEPIKGLANKLPEHAVRIAATLELFSNDIDSIWMISERYLKTAITITNYYQAEALRLTNESKVNSDLILAEKLLNWLHTSWTEVEISLPDIYQSSLYALGDRATAKRIVAILEEHEWLVKLATKSVIKGKVRKDAWLVIRRPQSEM